MPLCSSWLGLAVLCGEGTDADVDVPGREPWAPTACPCVLCPQLRRMQEMIARMQAQMQLQMQGGDSDGGVHGHHV